jgi:uncharacterized BrkB/YihY/UPF0761 family membrane protein
MAKRAISKRAAAKPARSEGSVLADAAAAAALGAATALVESIRRRPALPEPTPADGLTPTEPSGVLAKLAGRSPKLRLPAAIVQRYSALRCGQLAALIAFTGFLSIFPLMIALNTTLDLVLSGRPHLRRHLVKTTLGSVPVIGDQLKVGSSHGSGLALVLGLLGAAWAALAAMNAVQTAFYDVWQEHDRPNLLIGRLKSLAGLIVVGLTLVAATGLAGVAADASLPLAVVWGTAAALVVNVVGVAAATVVLGPARARASIWRGAALSGVLLTALQVIGGVLVTHYLVGASATYGTFATVIALTSWFGLNAQATLVGTAWNAERTARLPPGDAPRSLSR